MTARSLQGGSRGILGASEKTLKNTKKLGNCMARLLRRNIQDFVQEVPVGSGYPLSVPAWPTPPPDFKVLGGGKGEVKPPKCPTRHPRVGGFYINSLTKTS